MSAKLPAKAKEVVARATSSSSSSSKATKKKAKAKRNPKMLAPVFELNFHLFEEGKETSVVAIDKKAVTIIRCGCWGWANFVKCLFGEDLVDWDSVSSKDKRDFDALNKYFDALTMSELDRAFIKKSPQRYTATLVNMFHSAAMKWSALMKHAKSCKRSGDACTAPVLKSNAPWRNVVIMFFKKFSEFLEVREQILDNKWKQEHPDSDEEKVVAKAKKRGSLPAYLTVNDEDDLDISVNKEMFMKHGGIATMPSEDEDEDEDVEGGEDGEEEGESYIPLPDSKKRKSSSSSSSSSSSTQDLKRHKQNVVNRQKREARALAQSKLMEEEDDSDDADPLETDDQDEEEAVPEVVDVTSAYGQIGSFIEDEDGQPSSSDEEQDEHVLWQQTYRVAKSKAKKLIKDPESSSREVTEMHDVLKNIWGDNKQMFSTNPFGEDPEDDVQDATEKWEPVWDKLYRRYKPKSIGQKTKSVRKKQMAKKSMNRTI